MTADTEIGTGQLFAECSRIVCRAALGYDFLEPRRARAADLRAAGGLRRMSTRLVSVPRF